MRGIKREALLRILLVEREPLTKYDLANRARCSRQWVILLLRELEHLGLVKGTKVKNRDKLLEYWFSLHKNDLKKQEYLVQEPLKFLKKVKLDYALTTYQAENMVQYYLFPTRTDVYIKEDDLEAWHEFIKKRGGLYGKGNLRLIVADENVWYGSQRIKGLTIVSMPQLIIDLLRENGPAREAGEMLLKRFK